MYYPGFSRETEPIGYICRERFNMRNWLVTEAEKFHHLPSASGDPGELVI